jgi:multidrug resistance efflux pump
MKSSRLIRVFSGFTVALLCVFCTLTILSIVIDIDDAVEATGSVETETSHVVRATCEGVVKRILVQDGSRVNQGENLVSLNNEELARQIEELKLNLLELKEGRKSLMSKLGYLMTTAHAGEIENLQTSRRKQELTLQAASAEKDVEEIEKDRMASLFNQGLVSQRQYDQERLRYHLLEVKESQQKESLTQIEQDLKTSRDRHKEDLSQLAQELERNQIESDKIQLQIAYIENKNSLSMITAPKNGVVFLGQEPEKLIGQTMRTGEKIAELVDAQSMVFHALVPEDHIRKLKEGQEVNLELKALPYQKFKVFKGIVTEIAQQPSGAKGAEAIGYRVKVKLSDISVDISDGGESRVYYLKPGFSGIARIIVSHDLMFIKWLKIQLFGEEI